MKLTAYIAGPMSGYPLWNFPAFDDCRDHLIELGYDVISPADLDREIGFDPITSKVDKEFLDLAMARDIEAIMKSDLMVMLPGWRASTGATAEYWLARWRHMPVRQWPSMDYVEFEIIPRKQAVNGTKLSLSVSLPDGILVGFADTPMGPVAFCDSAFTNTGLWGTLDGAYATQGTPYPKTSTPQSDEKSLLNTILEGDSKLMEQAKVFEYVFSESELLSQKEPEEDILEEALRITKGDRQAQYGPVEQDFARVTKMWSALKGVEFEARDVAMFMICLKLSRETHQRKRDNSVDIAGYARLLHLINEAPK